MKVDIFCAGVCRDNGKPTQIAGCGVIVKMTDDHDRVQFREFGWALGSSSFNLANIQAARLGLSSLLPQFRGYETTLYTPSQYVSGLVTYTIESKKNEEEVAELRKWYGYYKNISVFPILNDQLKRARDLAQEAMRLQQHYDSGTILDGDN